MQQLTWLELFNDITFRGGNLCVIKWLFRGTFPRGDEYSSRMSLCWGNRKEKLQKSSRCVAVRVTGVSLDSWGDLLKLLGPSQHYNIGGLRGPWISPQLCREKPVSTSYVGGTGNKTYAFQMCSCPRDWCLLGFTGASLKPVGPSQHYNVDA